MPDWATMDPVAGPSIDSAVNEIRVAIFPNTENLTPEEAIARLGSDEHNRALDLMDSIYQQAGLKITSKGRKSVVGVGKNADGTITAENSMFKVVQGDPKAVRYAAAFQGKALNQKSVLVFSPSSGGPHVIYEFTVKGVTTDEGLAKISKEVLNDLPGAAIHREGKGLKVWVVDDGREATDIGAATNKLAEKYGTDRKFHSGTAEYIDNGQYDNIIREWEGAPIRGPLEQEGTRAAAGPVGGGRFERIVRDNTLRTNLGLSPAYDYPSREEISALLDKTIAPGAGRDQTSHVSGYLPGAMPNDGQIADFAAQGQVAGADRWYYADASGKSFHDGVLDRLGLLCPFCGVVSVNENVAIDE